MHSSETWLGWTIRDLRQCVERYFAPARFMLDHVVRRVGKEGAAPLGRLTVQQPEQASPALSEQVAALSDTVDATRGHMRNIELYLQRLTEEIDRDRSGLRNDLRTRQPSWSRQPRQRLTGVNDPTSGRLAAANQVEGAKIYNLRGESLGNVEDVLIDKISGRIAYAVVGFGGFLGIGDRHYPIPWETLKYEPSKGAYVVDVDRRALEGAPSYASNETAGWEDPAWNRRVYDYYGAAPYWNMP